MSFRRISSAPSIRYLVYEKPVRLGQRRRARARWDTPKANRAPQRNRPGEWSAIQKERQKILFDVKMHRVFDARRTYHSSCSSLPAIPTVRSREPQQASPEVLFLGRVADPPRSALLGREGVLCGARFSFPSSPRLLAPYFSPEPSRPSAIRSASVGRGFRSTNSWVVPAGT